MLIYTGQLAKKHLYQSNGLRLVDTTVKSGMKEFAPTWDMVLGVKGGTLSPEEYTEAYKSMMASSYKLYRKVWLDILSSDKPVILCCYCESGKFCHRHLLLEYFVAVARHHSIAVSPQGEFNPPGVNESHQLGMFDL